MENKIIQYDRFNLEEEIQNVWQTKDDLNAVAERLFEDTVFMTEDQIAEKKASPALFPETDLDMNNVSLESIVSINGEDNYKVKVVNGDNEIFRYYNTSTNLLTQVESTTEAQGQEIKTVVSYNNYSPVNGVQLPYGQTIVSGPQTISMNFKAIKVNEGVTDADFE